MQHEIGTPGIDGNSQSGCAFARCPGCHFRKPRTTQLRALRANQHRQSLRNQAHPLSITPCEIPALTSRLQDFLLITMDADRKRPTEAYYSTTLFDQGMGHVVVARFKLSGEAEIGVFLVDVFCLGVKDAFYTRLWEPDYDGSFLARVFHTEGKTPIAPACARKLVEDAVEYANQLGLAAHADYRVARRVFGGIDARQCDRTFTFGKDGKPFYIQGPNESPARVQAIMRQLENRCGVGHFDFFVLTDSAGAEWQPD